MFKKLSGKCLYVPSKTTHSLVKKKYFYFIFQSSSENKDEALPDNVHGNTLTAQIKFAQGFHCNGLYTKTHLEPK